MIQVSEALSIITDNSKKMPVRTIKVSKSLGYIVAETVHAPIAMPPFRQSAMDGYAFTHSKNQKYNVIGVSQAGEHSNCKVKPDQALRIFTGAFVPDSVDTVVMQEHVTVNGGSIVIDQMPESNANVRRKGEQVNEGDIVLEKDVVLTPAAIGFLACLGITDIQVYKKPKVAILVTGNELVQPGRKLKPGKIFESNSIMLQVALEAVGIKKAKIFRVKDSLKATDNVLKKLLSKYDMILVSGGISVGDYDFVKEALLKNKVKELFYKINQKPGKPLFFGSKDDKLVFALPGNPASSLTSFYVYVVPALKRMMGFEDIHLKKMVRKLDATLTNSTKKTLFLKALYNETHVAVLDSQSSAMLNTFATANCLLIVPHDRVEINKNQNVTLLPLD
jgi:molybdopterin molybdotransferase